MKSQLIYLALGTLIGAVIGFIGANSLNRSATNTPAGSVSTAPAVATEAGQTTLSPEEIKAQLAKADANPADVVFQKSLGIALYGYGAGKEDPSLIADAIRLLERAGKADAGDRDVLVALGNAHFDIGYFTKDGARYAKARGYYNRALELKPRDPNVMVDVGLTYALTEPPDLNRAIEAYRLALAVDGKHERTLQMMTDALLKSGDPRGASQYLARLTEVNPSNPMIPEFSKKVSGEAR